MRILTIQPQRGCDQHVDTRKLIVAQSRLSSWANADLGERAFKIRKNITSRLLVLDNPLSDATLSGLKTESLLPRVEATLGYVM